MNQNYIFNTLLKLRQTKNLIFKSERLPVKKSSDN